MDFNIYGFSYIGIVMAGYLHIEGRLIDILFVEEALHVFL